MHQQAPSILMRIAAGDSRAVAACVDEYGGMIAALAERYLRPLGLDTDDAVQEIFIELWRHAARYRPENGSEASFIATIAHRRLIDRQRRHASRPTAVSVSSPLDGSERSFPAPAQAGGYGTSDEARSAAQAFGLLTPDEREVVWLTICHGYSHERASMALNTPLGTVKTRVRRALVRMREFLAQQRGGAARSTAAQPVLAAGGKAHR
jgi:RNA polymerase sigma-70 factor (ECF subfamily)